MGLPAYTATAREEISTASTAATTQFQWREHARLSWNDFRGPVTTAAHESAAATFCSIGYRTSTTTEGKLAVEVYNTFYANRSWVKEDARLQSILDHEQGHFDLCEIYTRKLRQLAAGIDAATPGAKQQLINLYLQVSAEYEARQQAYEEETTHGTVLAEQKRWQDAIANELM